MSVDDQSSQTPLMKQYWELKAKAGDALLLFRMGDFYELFAEDAVTASRILEITLTARDKNRPNPTPMAGVPHHSIQGYIQRLLKAGKKVAIGEQMEDPAATKGIVRRDIVRVFTPAVQFEAEGTEPVYLATVVREDDTRWVLACLDSSTGEALVGDPVDAATLVNHIAQFPIKHFLRFGSDFPAVANAHAPGTLLEEIPSNYLSTAQATECLKRHYGIQTLDAFVTSRAGNHALGILVTYVTRTQRQETLSHLRLPSPLHRPKEMTLGPRTAEHLDLLPTPNGQPNLYQRINRTRSSLGARQLRRWLANPLKAPEAIERRQTAVRELSQRASLLEKLSAELAQLYDLERISGRITTRLANPRDTLALGQSLSILPRLSTLSDLTQVQSPLLKDLCATLDRLRAELQPLATEIVRIQKEDAPLVARDGGIFAKGTTPELDRLLSLTEDGERWLVELEAREREATGIASLKVRYNRVFGYYIEITQAHLKNVPSHYQRKQTTVGAERFFTEELKKFEDEIVSASSKQKALELQLFEELIQKIHARTPQIMEAAAALGELDSLLSLARLADEPGWAFPVIDDSLDLEIEAGRHPLVDSSGEFVPNDLKLSPETRLTLLITGPNMGGKSTVMRQVALIVILGQIGAPIPAKRARWGSVSSVHTRIGAHDAIARGQSTFMVEMTELAHILHHSDDRSLIILDEIGRGTSTYDGMSVAWATLEWICNGIRARTLFATHYHELTRLATTLPRLANAHMAVEASRATPSGQQESLRFLYLLREGPTNESFGVHVARIAGLPAPVIQRAWKVLEELESGAAHAASSDTSQLSLFGFAAAPAPASPHRVEIPPAPPHPALTELQGANLNEMTPLQALLFLQKLQTLQ